MSSHSPTPDLIDAFLIAETAHTASMVAAVRELVAFALPETVEARFRALGELFTSEPLLPTLHRLTIEGGRRTEPARGMLNAVIRAFFDLDSVRHAEVLALAEALRRDSGVPTMRPRS